MTDLSTADADALKGGCIPGVRISDSVGSDDIAYATWAGGQALVAWLAERGVTVASFAVDNAVFAAGDTVVRVLGECPVHVAAGVTADVAADLGTDGLHAEHNLLFSWNDTEPQMVALVQARLAALPLATAPTLTNPVAETLATLITDHAKTKGWDPGDAVDYRALTEIALMPVRDPGLLTTAQLLTRDRHRRGRRGADVRGR